MQGSHFLPATLVGDGATSVSGPQSSDFMQDLRSVGVPTCLQWALPVQDGKGSHKDAERREAWRPQRQR